MSSNFTPYPLLFSIILEILARIIKQKKGGGDKHFGKEEVKIFLIADDMILCTESPKSSTKFTRTNKKLKSTKNLLGRLNSAML